MRLIKFLILPFLSVFIFAQTKIENATKSFNDKDYSKVIEILENESINDYRVLFLMTSSKFKLISENTDPEEVYKIKEMAMLYNNKYHNNIDSKKKGYSNIIVNILDNYKKNYPETKEQYYAQREKEIAAQKEK